MPEFFEVYLITFFSVMGKQYLFLLGVKNMKRKLGINLGFSSLEVLVFLCVGGFFFIMYIVFFKK